MRMGPSRAFSQWAGCVCALAILFPFAATMEAQSAPPIVLTETNWLGVFPAGGRVLTAANGAGTSFAVNASGEVAAGDTYGGEVLLFNGRTGAMTVLGSFKNAGAVALDAEDNLYVAGLYTSYIVKLPYKDGTYAKLTADPQATLPPACTGADTAECLWGANLRYSGNGNSFGVVAMTFDAAGNFFFATNGYGGPDRNPYSIFECSADSGCMATANSGSGGGAPVKLFTEPAATASTVCGTGGAMMQGTVGSLAVDPWGNLFFTDSLMDTCNSPDGFADQSDSSGINELAFVGGAFAPTPVRLYTLTPSDPAPYNDEIDAVGVDSNGTVYFASQYGGVLGFRNDGTPFTGKIAGGDIYGVSTTGAKALAADGKGDLYVVGSWEGVGGGYLDTLGRVSVNHAAMPAGKIGAMTGLETPDAVSSKVNATDSAEVMVNDADCSTAKVSLAFSKEGSGSTEFSGMTGGCADSNFFAGQSVFPVTLSFTPAAVGTRSAAVTATNTATGGSGAATVFGVGQGGLATLYPENPPTVYDLFTEPVGVAVDEARNGYVADAGAGTITVIRATSPTEFVIGSGFNTPSGVALDAKGDLYVADTGNNQIVEIPNATGAPGTQKPLVPGSVKFGGTALNRPTGLAMGADGVLYISDTGNGRVVSYDPANGTTAVRAVGLKMPGGIAVDADGTLYVADAGDGNGGEVDVYPSGGGAVMRLKPAGVTTPIGVAVDASGSVLISDGPTGAVVRVPNEGGTLNASDAAVVETNPYSGGGLALDSDGNLYTTDVTGATVYAIERTAATVNFGSVDAGASAQKTVWVEDSGNLPLALAAGAASFLTQPATANFSITAGANNDCLAAAALDPGQACEFVAEFAPAAGTAAGNLSDSASFESTAVDGTAPIRLNGTVKGSEGGSTGTAGFTIGLGKTSLTVKPGGSATTMVSITPQNGFSGKVSFSCSGLPAGAACSFSPASVTASEGPETTQLTISASSNMAGLRRDGGPMWPGGAALAGILFCCVGFRRRRGLGLVLLAAVSVAATGLMSGCGVQFNPAVGARTTIVSVNATSGQMESSATLTLIVQR